MTVGLQAVVTAEGCKLALTATDYVDCDLDQVLGARMNVVGIAIFLPIVAAIIGWTTKWMALKLIFKPERRVGIGPIAWQGIVVRRAEKFASGIADTVSGAALDLDELFDRIDAEALADLIGPVLDQCAPDLSEAVVETVRPGTWGQMPPADRQAISEMIAIQGRTAAEEIIEEIKPVVKESIDLHDLIISLLSGENAGRLSRLVQLVGSHELRWIIWYGAVMGFLIGVVEVGFYISLERWWILPVVGAFDGLVNNWLAIQMIFLPRERKKYLGILPYQGMFPARQAEISRNYATMMADEILTFDNLAELLARTGGAARIGAAARHAAAVKFGPALQVLTAATDAEPGPELTDRVFDAVAPIVAAALLPERDRLAEYLDKKLELASTMEERLAALPKVEFETILRSIFREDEATLISLGGVLGTAIGVLQALIVVASGLGK